MRAGCLLGKSCQAAGFLFSDWREQREAGSAGGVWFYLSVHVGAGQCCPCLLHLMLLTAPLYFRLGCQHCAWTRMGLQVPREPVAGCRVLYQCPCYIFFREEKVLYYKWGLQKALKMPGLLSHLLFPGTSPNLPQPRGQLYQHSVTRLSSPDLPSSHFLTTDRK